MIVILGDIHFASSKDYFVAIGNSVVDWFESWSLNNKDNELILVGDLVLSAINAGLVVELLYRFFEASRFSHIHVVKGNHDEKLKDDIYQLAYSFLRYKKNVTIYDDPTAVSIQGKQVLMLPHYNATSTQQPMVQRYSNLYKESQWQRHFDLLVGHFADNSVAYLNTEAVWNLERLDVDIICLGHIHTRGSNPQRYIGSLFANRVNENADDRAAWIIDDGGKREEPLPKFSEFLLVRYPEPLPHSDALVPIYTVTNCSSEAVAKTLYGDIFIRKVIQELSRSELSVASSALNLSDSDIVELFADFMRSQQPPIDRRVASVCVPLVKNTTKCSDGTSSNS